MFHFPIDHFRNDRPQSRRARLAARWVRDAEGRLCCRWVRVPEYR